MSEHKEQQRLASVAVVENIMQQVASAYTDRLTQYGLTYRNPSYEFLVLQHTERVPVHRFTSGSTDNCTHADPGRAEKACQFIAASVRNGRERLGYGMPPASPEPLGCRDLWKR